MPSYLPVLHTSGCVKIKIEYAAVAFMEAEAFGLRLNPVSPVVFVLKVE